MCIISFFCLQIVSYFAQGQSRSNTCDIFRISGGKIRCGDSAFYHDIIHIPPLPPSRLDHCRLIHTQYVITVRVSILYAYTCEYIICVYHGSVRVLHVCIKTDIIQIPLLPPSRLDHCRLIHTQYVITVRVSI